MCDKDWGENWSRAYDEGKVAVYRYGGIDLLCQPACRERFEAELESYENENVGGEVEESEVEVV
jgi:response regulator of citrate/malate metabolism